jgi:hypothetical protein
MFPSRRSKERQRISRYGSPSSRRSRPLTRPGLLLELLEDRTLLSGLPLDGAITSALLTGNSVVQSAIGTLDANLFNSLGNSLPLVGKALGPIGKSAQDFFNPIGNSLSAKFSTLGQTIYDTDVENAITSALKSLGLNQPALKAISDTVTPNQAGTAIENIELNLDIKGNLIDSKVPINFDTGLSQLNLKVTGNVTVSLGYEFKVGLGIDDNGFYIDGTGTNFALTLDVTAPGLSLAGTLFFLQVTATDGTQAGKSGFHASLGLSLASKNNNHISLGANTPLDLNASFSAQADAEIHLNTNISFGNNADFPSLDADFDLSWTISAGTPLDSSSNTDVASFGDEPKIGFNNIKLDVGSFFSQFVTPIVQDVKKVLDPIQPVLDVLNARIPVLSDIGPLKQALNVGPNDPVTLLDVVAALDSGADTKFLKAVVALDQLVNTVPSVNGGTLIPLGSFDFQSNGLDARVTDLTQSSLTTVTADPQAILGELKNIPGVGNFVTQITDKLQFGGEGTPDDGGSIQFPLIENPKLAFGLLLGQNVSLFTFDMPTFRPSAQFEKFFPILGPLGIDFRGTVPDNLDPAALQNTAFEALIHFAFGYDTQGIVDFAKDKFDPSKVGDLLDGLYVSTTDQPDGSGSNFVPQVKLYAGFGAFAALKFPAFDAGVGGGINGDILFTLNDPDKDGKLRWNEILTDLANGGPLGLFSVSGELSAELEAFVQIGFQSPFGFVGYENDFDIAKETLLNFNFNAQSDPVPVLAAELGGGKLRLNIGQFAGQRQVGDLSNHDETFAVADGGHSPIGPGERVIVTAYGYEQTYDNVTEIDANCGPGDSVTINQGVTANAVLVGGDGNNHLIYDGSGSATLDAFGSGNVLSGGSGSNILDATQATGNDTLIGGSGTNEFHAATNAPMGVVGDKMLAGPHGDTMHGGDAVDVFSAGAGNDVMYGGSGGGIFNWKEGDGNPTVIGGSGPAQSYHIQADVNTAGAAFVVQAGQTLPLEVDIAIPGGKGGHQILAKNVGVVSVDDEGDGATYTVNNLTGTGVQYVQANEHEASHAGGAPDHVTVNGSQTLPNIVDITADPAVTAANILDQQGQIVQPIMGPVTNVSMTINEGAGNPLTGGGTIQYQIGLAIPKTADTLTVNTGAADDTVSALSTQSALDGTSRGGDVYVNTLAGNNTINLGANPATVARGEGLLDRIQGNLYIDAGSGSQNQLNIDESGAVNGDTLALTADHLFNLNKGSTVLYQLLRYTAEELPVPEGGGPIGSRLPPEKRRYPLLIQYTASSGGIFGAGVNLYLTRAADSLYVTDTMKGAPTTIYADGNQNSNNPKDQIVVGYNPLDIYTNAMKPQQSYLDNILGPLDVEGTDWAHNGIGDADLRVFDEAAASTAQYMVTAASVQRLGVLPITYAQLGEPGFTGDLSLIASSASSTIFVQGTAKNTNTTVTTGSGSATILVGQPVSLSPPLFVLDFIQGQLNINGGGGSDGLIVEDNGNLPYTYTLSVTTLQRLGAVGIAPINFKHMTTLDLYEPSAANNTTIVHGTPLGTAVTVHTGDGNDGLTVSTLDKIQGPLDFAWTSGIKSLVFNDVTAGANTYTLKPLELDRTGAAAIQFDHLSFEELFVGLLAKEAIGVSGIDSGTHVSVVAGSGPDMVVAASGGENLSALLGTLDVQGGGNTTVYLEDQKVNQGRSYSLNSDHFLVAGQQPIDFTDLTGLFLDAGLMGNQTSVYGTPAGTHVTVNAGANDEVVASDASKTLQGIQGRLDVVGAGSGDNLILDDTQGALMSSYLLTSGEVDHAPSAAVGYKNLAALTLKGSAGFDVYHVAGTALATQYQLKAGGGGNILEGPKTASLWSITGPNSGALNGNVGFSSMQSLLGDVGPDTFAMQQGGSLSGFANGGAGTNTLDYSKFLGDVTVNLRLKTATGIAGGISNIQNVNGSQGDDLIVGDAGPNALKGGTGRNILIGGAGADSVTGGGADNILIGGTTLWDANAVALQALMQEWMNPNVTFDQRVNALKQGIVVNNKTYAFNNATVFADASPDSLVGGGGRNWFWVDNDDTINHGAGPKSTDRVN